MTRNSLATLKFNVAASEVYGSSYVQRLSEHKGILLRTVQRWASGYREPPEDIINELRATSELLEQLQLDAGFRIEANRALEQGVDPFIIAGLLERMSAELRGHENKHLGSGFLKLPLNYRHDLEE